MSPTGAGTPFKWPTDEDLTLVVEIHKLSEKNESKPVTSGIQKPEPKLPNGGLNYCW